MKQRGFEKISERQWNIDYSEKEIGDGYWYIKNSLLYEDIQLPKRMTAYSAGYDIFSPVAFVLQPGESIKIPTGIRVYMQDDEVFKVYSRSGLGFKYFLRLANGTGVIDSDYYNAKNEGHIWAKIRNESGNDVITKMIDFLLLKFSNESFYTNILESLRKLNGKTLEIKMGEGIAQGIFQKYLIIDGDGYGIGNVRENGLGSTTM